MSQSSILASEPAVILPLSINRQKVFVVENRTLLTKDKCRIILDLVWANDETAALITDPVTKELSLDLDRIVNSEIVTQIYQFTLGQRQTLSQPATE
jgi:hypothetical protein